MHAATKTSSIIAAPSIKDASKLIKLRDFVKQFPEEVGRVQAFKNDILIKRRILEGSKKTLQARM